MYLYGFFAVSLILIISLIILYITSRITLVFKVQAGDFHTKQLTGKINKFLFLFLFFEIISSIISIVPPISSPILFIITLLSTSHDIFLYFKKTFLIPNGIVRKSLDSIETRFEIKLIIWLIAFGYLIYLIIKESQRKNLEIRTSQIF